MFQDLDMASNFGDLDENRQLAAGARDSNGNVPNSYFNSENGKTNLNNVNPGDRNPGYGVRRVVSTGF